MPTDSTPFLETIALPSATTGTAEQSLLAAHEEALNSHLQARLRIEFNYFANEVDAGTPPKGLAQIFRRTDEETQPLTCEPQRYKATIALRILLTGNNHAQLRRLVADWDEALNREMQLIKVFGISGFYRGHLLTNAFTDLQQATPDSLPSESSDQRQDLEDGLFRGAVQAQYEFMVVPQGAIG